MSLAKLNLLPVCLQSICIELHVHVVLYINGMKIKDKKTLILGVVNTHKGKFAAQASRFDVDEYDSY